MDSISAGDIVELYELAEWILELSNEEIIDGLINVGNNDELDFLSIKGKIDNEDLSREEVESTKYIVGLNVIFTSLTTDKFEEIGIDALKLFVTVGDNDASSFCDNVEYKMIGVGAENDKYFKCVLSDLIISEVLLWTHRVPSHTNPGQHIGAALS